MENQVADHLSRLETLEQEKGDNSAEFPDEKIFSIQSIDAPWFADFANFHAGGWIPRHLMCQQKRKFLADAKHYFWEDPILYKLCVDQVIRKCVSGEECNKILSHYHEREPGGHFGANRTATKVLQSGFYWPTLFKVPNDL